MSNPRRIVQVLRMWLDDDSGLENAIRKTADQGLFPEGDIRFAVEHLRNAVSIDKIEKWVDRAARNSVPTSEIPEKPDFEQEEKTGSQPDAEYRAILNPKTDADRHSGPDTKPLAPKKNTLCLHAGNLPLVGFQDVIAVMLSGNRYFGKISRKDPWLIASFLDVCQKEVPDLIGSYSTDIGSFSNLNADAVIFTGSEKSVKPVKSELESLGAVHQYTRYLIRTAQLSAAYIESKSSFQDLAEAVTRYSGRGCRSVGVVVSPMDLEDYRIAESGSGRGSGRGTGTGTGRGTGTGTGRGTGTGTGETIILENGLKYAIAYARAVGLPVLQLADQFIIQSNDISMIRPGVVLWVKGDMETLGEIRATLGGRLQTVYSDTKRSAETYQSFEPLGKAQKPDIDWMPDGVDTLEWLGR